ncbi:MAG: guanylate kinase [Oscillospiraceae bacterium]|nr:guanylate kinase [Oscillospiraceae bacterium]
MKSDGTKGLLIVLSGPSGCGKDTVLRELKKIDGSLAVSVSATTRKPRACDAEGVNYYFLSEDEFTEKIENGDFVEYVRYNNYYYGTLVSELETKLAAGKTVVMVIEVRGAANIIDKYPDALSIFLMPPSLDVLEERLRGRGTEMEDDILYRLKTAELEMQESSHYKYVIISETIEKTVNTVYNIIKGWS